MITFNKPSITELEKKYILDSLETKKICGDNKYTKKCNELIKEKFGFNPLLTTSGSTALDLAALLCEIKPGDEVIVPSFTFVSTANAFILRHAKIIFADIDKDTMNIDPSDIEKKITSKTKVICVVHYAGVACDMDKIMKIARKHNIKIVEDAAQAIGSYYKGKMLGTIGDYGAFSFHETKNIAMGEGGMIVVKDIKDFEKAEMIREKGTNRNQYFKGFVDKYTWQVPGDSLLPSDILSALLYAQLERFDEIQNKRLKIWNYYFKKLKMLEEKKKLRRPIIPDYATNNAHIFYLIMNSEKERDNLINFLKEKGIQAPFHYIPLHESTMGKKLGYKIGDLPTSEEYSKRLIRLPLYYDLKGDEIKYIVESIFNYFGETNED